MDILVTSEMTSCSAERLINIEIGLYGRKIIVLGAYGQVKYRFMETLGGTIRKIKPIQVILTGDLNGRRGRKDKVSIVENFGEEEINDNGELNSTTPEKMTRLMMKKNYTYCKNEIIRDLYQKLLDM